MENSCFPVSLDGRIVPCGCYLACCWLRGAIEFWRDVGMRGRCEEYEYFVVKGADAVAQGIRLGGGDEGFRLRISKGDVSSQGANRTLST